MSNTAIVPIINMNSVLKYKAHISGSAELVVVDMVTGLRVVGKLVVGEFVL